MKPTRSTPSRSRRPAATKPCAPAHHSSIPAKVAAALCRVRADLLANRLNYRFTAVVIPATKQECGCVGGHTARELGLEEDRDDDHQFGLVKVGLSVDQANDLCYNWMKVGFLLTTPGESCDSKRAARRITHFLRTAQ